MRFVKTVLINLVIVLAVLFVADRLLAVFGYPAEVPLQTAHRPNVSKKLKTIEFEYDFVTNDLGLRYPPVAAEKSPGSARILMLGDSFTEGVGVEAEDTFGMALERYYGRARGNEALFINGGLGGEGPVRFWRVFQYIGLGLHPDGVLLCIYANDLMDTPEDFDRNDLYRQAPVREGFSRFFHHVLPRVHNVLVEAGRIVERELRQSGGFVADVTSRARERGISQEAIDTWVQALPPALVEASDRGEFNKSLLSMGLVNPDYWNEAINITTDRAEQKYRSFRLILDEIAATSRSHGMAVGLVYIPAPLQYDLLRHESWNPWIIGGVRFRREWARDESELQRRLAAWALQHDVPFLDLTPVLRAAVAAGDSLNFRLDGHWNPRGHEVAATAIADWIDGNDVFPVLRGRADR